jgi:hypothetical protein
VTARAGKAKRSRKVFILILSFFVLLKEGGF